MAHWCNLVIQILVSLILVKEIESLLASMYTYYIQPSKDPLNTLSWQRIKSRGLKFLNIKTTWWISTLAPFKWVFNEYKMLVVKMNDAVVNIPIVKNHL